MANVVTKVFTAILCALLQFQLIHGANIVFFFGIATYSHQITAWPLVEKLAENGHNVTFISAYSAKKPNARVHEMTPKSLVDWVASWDEGPQAFEDRKTGRIYSNWMLLPEFGQVFCELFLSDKSVIDWIERTPVDLVVIDSLYNDCGLAIAHKNKAKHMIFGTTSVLPWHYDVYGIPVESSWIPDMIYHYPQNMTFMERLKSTLNPILWNYLREYKTMPALEELMKEKLGLHDIRLRDMEREPSLVLMNTYFAEEFARSLPPAVIPIGGMHCKDSNNPLSKELEAFVNKHGQKGFVYVSFGSAVEISHCPPEIKNVFFTILRKFKEVQFIWKWEGEFPKDQAPNILFVKWAPQQDLLAHPKILAFITHSGLLSIQEAIFHGVPLVSLPVFAEQDYNAERIHRMKHGIRLEVTQITNDQLENAIHDIIMEPEYRNNMKLLSKRFKDRPMKPVDTAVWWTEFVLRHDDTSFLLPLSRNQTWYQRRLLDVWVVIFILLTLLFVATVFIVTKVFKSLFCSIGASVDSRNISSKKLKRK